MALDVKATSRELNRQADWKKIVKPYQSADTRKSIWQLVNTVGLLFIGWIFSDKVGDGALHPLQLFLYRGCTFDEIPGVTHVSPSDCINGRQGVAWHDC